MKLRIKFEREEECELPDTATVRDLLHVIERITGLTRGDYRVIHNSKIVSLQQQELELKRDLHFRDDDQVHVFSQIRPSRQTTPANEASEAAPQRQGIPFPGVPGINGGILSFEFSEDGRPIIREGGENLGGILGPLFQHMIPGLQNIFGQRAAQNRDARTPTSQHQRRPSEPAPQAPQPPPQRPAAAHETPAQPAVQPARPRQAAEPRQRRLQNEEAGIADIFGAVSQYEQSLLAQEIPDKRQRLLAAYNAGMRKVREREEKLIQKGACGEDIAQEMQENIKVQQRLLRVLDTALKNTNHTLQNIERTAGVQVESLSTEDQQAALDAIENLLQ